MGCIWKNLGSLLLFKCYPASTPKQIFVILQTFSPGYGILHSDLEIRLPQRPLNLFFEILPNNLHKVLLWIYRALLGQHFQIWASRCITRRHLWYKFGKNWWSSWSWAAFKRYCVGIMHFLKGVKPHEPIFIVLMSKCKWRK